MTLFVCVSSGSPIMKEFPVADNDWMIVGWLNHGDVCASVSDPRAVWLGPDEYIKVLAGGKVGWVRTKNLEPLQKTA